MVNISSFYFAVILCNIDVDIKEIRLESSMGRNFIFVDFINDETSLAIGTSHFESLDFNREIRKD